MRFASMLSGTLTIALVAACAGDVLGPPDEAPDVQGTVIGRMPDDRLLLASSVSSDIYPDTFFVNAGSRTNVLVLQADGSYRRGTAADASKGDVVRAWLTGIELRSLPPQYPAWQLELRPSLRRCRLVRARNVYSRPSRMIA